MLVSSMSLTEMRDECLKEVQHYIDVAMIKYKQALRFRNKSAIKEFVFKTKRNNNLLIRIELEKSKLIAYPYFWYYDNNGLAIIFMFDEFNIFVYRGHIIKRIIERFRLAYKPEVLIRTLDKLIFWGTTSERDENDEFHIINENGIIYYKFVDSGICVAKTFISCEQLTNKKFETFKKEIEEYYNKKLNNFSEEQ